MHRHIKEAACPCPPQSSSLDQRAELWGRMTTAHPDLELAGSGCHADEYYARRSHRHERMTTRTTLKHMTFPVGRLSMTTTRAALGGAARVNFNDGHTESFRLIPKEEIELTIRPSVNLCTLRFAQFPVSNAVKLLYRNDWTPRFNGERDNRLRDLVIDRLHKTLLSARQPFEQLRLGAGRLLCLFLLERLAGMQIPISDMLGMTASAHPIAPTVRCTGDHIDTPIHANHGIVWGGPLLNLFFEAEGEKDGFRLWADKQAAITKGPVSQLVFKARRAMKRHGLETALKRPDRETASPKRDMTAFAVSPPVA